MKDGNGERRRDGKRKSPLSSLAFKSNGSIEQLSHTGFPRTLRSFASSFIQFIDIKTLHSETLVDVTSALRWPSCGILSSAGCTGRMTCESSFVSSRGHYADCAWSALKFQFKRQTSLQQKHTLTPLRTRNRAHTSGH